MKMFWHKEFTYVKQLFTFLLLVNKWSKNYMTRDEWHLWRQKGLGGSDAPVVMGFHKYRTLLDLYEEKISTEVKVEETNFIQQKGNEAEVKVRALFELLQEEEYPADLVEQGVLRASLDGRSKCKTKIVEFKLLGAERWQECKTTYRVPDDHYPQVQHNLAVSRAEFCWYVGAKYKRGQNTFTSEDLVTLKIYPDLEYQKVLIEKELKFWECVVQKKKPEASSDDFKLVTGFQALTDKWKALNLKIKELETEQEDLRKQILTEAEKAKHPRLIFSGLKLVKQSRQGNVQYAKIPQLQGINLDLYRGNPTLFWKIEIE